MFNLEQSIANWRRQMLAAEIKSPVPLEELEGHLREETERLVRSGIHQQQAFEEAVLKIGPARELKTEFKKSRDWWGKIEITTKEQDLKWTRTLFLVISILIPLLTGGMIFSKFGNFSTMNPAERMSGLAALAVFSLFVWAGRLGLGMLPVIRSKRNRAIVGYSAGALFVLWLAIYSYIILPHYEFTMGQLLVSVLWSFITPWGALNCFLFGIEERAKSAAG
jgi:hypothetical protein